tara:strand:- start:949 stop:1356 length:408 start_codon:yes stop_codon:yes gene_type:complete
LKIKIDCTDQLGLKKMSVLNKALDAECTEIICINVLSSFSTLELPSIMKLLQSKIRIGGTLIVEEFDFRTISRRFYRDEITTEFANSAIFGNSATLKSIVDMDAVSSCLNADFKISEISYLGDQGRFILKTRREQ